jgi:hypothetical protein
MFVAQHVAVPVGAGRSALSVPPHPVVPQHKVHKVSSSYQHCLCSYLSILNILHGHGGFGRSMHLQNFSKSLCYCSSIHAYNSTVLHLPMSPVTYRRITQSRQQRQQTQHRTA